MTMIIQFPSSRAHAVRVQREADGPAWLVLTHDHGWLHGSFDAAISDARQLAEHFGVSVRSSAERGAP
jgi:hypothetical protein